MVNVKKSLLVLSLAISALGFAQGASVGKYYPQMYENQQVASSFTAADNKTAAFSAKGQLELSISAMQADPVMKNAHWGFVVYDPSTKTVVTSYRESESFVPASTTKLLTTETAVALLGPNFRWVTQLEYSGEVAPDGTLNGDLYIIGSGDPSLGTGKGGASTYSGIVNEFLSAIREKGIKRISGNITIQTAVFKENKLPSLPESIVWMEHGNYYLPVGSTVNIDPRREKLTVKQSNPFQDVKRYFYVSPYNRQMVFADEYSPVTLTTKLPDAPAYLANSLRTALLKNGISISGPVVSKLTADNVTKREIITAYKSPPLKDIIYATNQPSDNALAEALLRTVGFQKAGDQSLQSGRDVVTAHLSATGFDMNGLSYMDGSGLSKSNLVTPIAQAKFLANLMKSSYFKDFYQSLPIAGQSGTLKRMFAGPSYGQIFAKTGTLNKVKTLAGYIQTRSGKVLTFSLLVNNYAGSVDQVKVRMEQLLDPAVLL